MKKALHVIIWTLICVAGLAIQVYVAKWATETERDPDLDETVQFGPEQYVDVAGRITPESLQRHITALSSIPSRLTGTPGAEQAARYVMDQFRALGVGEPQVQEFDVVVPVHDVAEMHTDQGVFPIHPLYPNGVCPAALPEEGLETRLVYAGFGRLADVTGKDVEGSVVVVETGGRESWLYLFDLGAKAIIFVERERPARKMDQDTQTNSHQSVPRFYMTAQEAAPLLERLRAEDIPATLYSDARWEQRTGKNIWIDIPGVSDEPHNQKELVVLSAHYDSMSFVPGLAPGAEQTCGIASLLELGNLVSEYRFEKTVRLLATSGHFQALEGIRQYVWEHVGQHDAPMRDVSPQGHAAFFSLDLSSSSGRVGLFYGGHFFQQIVSNLKPRVADLGRRASDYAIDIADAFQTQVESLFVDTINPVAGKDWPTYLPTPLALEHEAALLAGIPALSFVTTNDSRYFAGTPVDQSVQIDNLVTQARLLACMLPNAFNVEGRYVKRSLPRSIARVRGRAVSFDPRAGYLPDKATPGAVVTTRHQGWPTMFAGSVATRPQAMTNDNGEFEFVCLGTSAEVPAHMATMAFEPYVIERGRITWAPDRGQMGHESYPITTMPVQREMELMCVVFECKALDLYSLIDPRNHNYLVYLDVLEAGSNSVPPVWGTTFLSPAWWSYHAPTAGIFAPSGTRLKISAGAGAMQKRLLFLNAPEETPEGERFNTGEGFLIDETPALTHSSLRAALDMWRLNESRIRFFGHHGIENARVTQLHEEARSALENAERFLQEKDYNQYHTETRHALSLEARAYPDVVGMANDTVRGLLFYLALLLPFAFTMERLFLAGRRIETRILGIILFFLIMFFLLRFSHPGFLIVLSPLVVLLGFVIAVLSTVMISIVMGKLETLVSKQKVEQQGEHESGVQAVSGFTLALEMGIANMRRRKARTVLTSITLVVLTFSVLSFVSVTEQVRMQRYRYTDGDTPYPGVLLRTRNWAPFPFETYTSLRSELEDRALVTPRRWYYGALVLNQSAVEVQRGYMLRTLRALIGLTSHEQRLFDFSEALIGQSRWLSAEHPGVEPANEVLLPYNMGVDFALQGMSPERRAELANRIIGQQIDGLGRELRVSGVFDPDVMAHVARTSDEEVQYYDIATVIPRQLWKIITPYTQVVFINADEYESTLAGPPAMVAENEQYSWGLAGMGGVRPDQEATFKPVFVGDSRMPQSGEVMIPLNLAVAMVLGRNELVNEVLGSQVSMIGREFEVVGVFDWAAMNEIVDIDGETLTPFDPIQMEQKAQEEGVPDPEEIQRYIHHSFKDVAIVSERVLGNLGGDVRSLAILPNDPDDLESLVESLVQRMDYILFANMDGEPMLLSSRDSTSISEYWNLIILTIIAALIVFNTMLGSVYERTKEIGTYTALGIAPSHIGRLFLVEAGVFSIIGVMAGYVLGQSIARVVYLADLPVLSALNLNYSSLAGVFACLIVMGVVLLSSLYPARKASEIGVPDIERRWKLPKTKDARVTLELPFTVSHHEAQGLVAYLKEYLDSHVDVSVGTFYVENVEAGPEVADGAGTGVRGQFWLTPFDLGVSQYTTIILHDLEGMDVCGAQVQLERLSGDAGSWRRANSRFMTDIRSQFLIWRNLGPDARSTYVERGAAYKIA